MQDIIANYNISFLSFSEDLSLIAVKRFLRCILAFFAVARAFRVKFLS